MKWQITYRIKGDSKISKQTFDLSFKNRNDVKRWWESSAKNKGDIPGFDIRYYTEFLNAKIVTK